MPVAPSAWVTWYFQCWHYNTSPGFHDAIPTVAIPTDSGGLISEAPAREGKQSSSYTYSKYRVPCVRSKEHCYRKVDWISIVCMCQKYILIKYQQHFVELHITHNRSSRLQSVAEIVLRHTYNYQKLLHGIYFTDYSFQCFVSRRFPTKSFWRTS
jgi:hypothetical protein